MSWAMTFRLFSVTAGLSMPIRSVLTPANTSSPLSQRNSASGLSRREADGFVQLVGFGGEFDGGERRHHCLDLSIAERAPHHRGGD